MESHCLVLATEKQSIISFVGWNVPTKLAMPCDSFIMLAIINPTTTSNLLQQK